MEQPRHGHPRIQIDAVKKIICIEQMKAVGAIHNLENIVWLGIGQTRQSVIKSISDLKAIVHFNAPLESSIHHRLNFFQRYGISSDQHIQAVEEVKQFARRIGFPQLMDMAQDALEATIRGLEQDPTSNARGVLRQVNKLSRSKVDTTTHEITNKSVNLEVVDVEAFMEKAIRAVSTIPEIVVLSLDRRCSLCQQQHQELECTMAQVDKAAVVVRQKLCLQCLRAHTPDNCENPSRCDQCGGAHHSSICNPDLAQAEMPVHFRVPCAYCKGPHSAIQCQIPPRLKRTMLDVAKACQRCLSRSHQLNDCKDNSCCEHCGEPHHYIHCTIHESLGTMDKVIQDQELARLRKALEWVQTIGKIHAIAHNQTSHWIQGKSTFQGDNDNNIISSKPKSEEVSTPKESQFSDEMTKKKTPSNPSVRVQPSEAHSEWTQPVTPEIVVISSEAGSIQSDSELIPRDEESSIPPTDELETSSHQSLTWIHQQETATPTEVSGQSEDSNNLPKDCQDHHQAEDHQSEPDDTPTEKDEEQTSAGQSSDEESSEDEEDYFNKSNEESSPRPCIIHAQHSWDANFIRSKIYMSFGLHEKHRINVGETLEFHRYEDDWSNTKKAIIMSAQAIRLFRMKVSRLFIPTVVVFFHNSKHLSESINKGEKEFFTEIQTIIEGPHFPNIQFFRTTLNEVRRHQHDGWLINIDLWEIDFHNRLLLKRDEDITTPSERGLTNGNSGIVLVRRDRFTVVCCRTGEGFTAKTYKLQMDQNPSHWKLIRHWDNKTRSHDEVQAIETYSIEALEEIGSYVHAANRGRKVESILVIHNSSDTSREVAHNKDGFLRLAKEIALESMQTADLRLWESQNIPNPRDEGQYQTFLEVCWNQSLKGTSSDCEETPTKDKEKDGSINEDALNRSSEEEPTRGNLLSSEDLQKADHSAPRVSRR